MKISQKYLRGETALALELFISGHDFDSKTDERVGGEKRNVQSLKSGMKILEIAQWDTWSRYFWEIVSIILIFWLRLPFVIFGPKILMSNVIYLF